MPILQDILAVPRPKNTIVIAYGKDKSLFAVRQRVGNGLAADARTKGTCDISVLYAFDLEAIEPVCSKCVFCKPFL